MSKQDVLSLPKESFFNDIEEGLKVMFNSYSIDKVKDVILTINSDYKYRLYLAITKNKNNKSLERVIEEIKNKLDKKDLCKYLNVKTKEEAQEFIDSLSEKNRRSILKEFYIYNKEEKDYLTNEEKKENRRQIYSYKQKNDYRNKVLDIKMEKEEYFNLIDDSFFAMFKNSDMNEVKDYIWSLNSKYKTDLYYGYNKYTGESKNERSLLVVNKIKSVFYKQSLAKSFNLHSLKEIADFLSKYSQEDRRLLLKVYYINREEEKEKLSLEEKNRLGILVNSSYNYCYKEFYSLFNFDKELVNKVLKTLPIEDLLLIYKKYGNDLTNTFPNEELTYEEKYNINTRIIYNIRRKLERIKEGKIKFIKLSDYINIDDIELVKNRLNLLLITERNKIIYYFGENLTKERLISIDKSYNIITPRMAEILEGKVIKNKPIVPFISRYMDCKREDESIEAFRERLMLVVNTVLTTRDKALLMKMFGSNFDKTIDDGSVTYKEKTEISRRISLKIRYNLNKPTKLNKYINELSTLRLNLLKRIILSEEFENIAKETTLNEALESLAKKYNLSDLLITEKIDEDSIKLIKGMK